MGTPRLILKNQHETPVSLRLPRETVIDRSPIM